MPPRHERYFVVTRKCDICGDAYPDAWWKAFTLEPVIVPESSIDPDTGRLGATIYPVTEAWGVCGPCKDFVEEGVWASLAKDTHWISELRTRCIRFMGADTPFYLVLRIATCLSLTEREPWVESEAPPATGITKTWVE